MPVPRVGKIGKAFAALRLTEAHEIGHSLVHRLAAIAIRTFRKVSKNSVQKCSLWREHRIRCYSYHRIAVEGYPKRSNVCRSPAARRSSEYIERPPRPKGVNQRRPSHNLIDEAGASTYRGQEKRRVSEPPVQLSRVPHQLPVQVPPPLRPSSAECAV
jgi:hypothetical protein